MPLEASRSGNTSAGSALNADVVLRDGSTVLVRPARRDDEEAIRRFLQSLTSETLALRFFGSLSRDALAEKARELASPPGDPSLALLALQGPGPGVVGHAMYVATGPARAEVAFVISEEVQGRGLGSILLLQLAQVASARGIEVFEAGFLPRNHRMLSVFRDSGFALRTRALPGEIRVEFPTEVTGAALDRLEQREAVAAVNAVATLLRPRSVAAIGASREPDSIGGVVFHNLLEFGFHGPVAPVNPSGSVVQSILAYPDVESVPVDVDLAVVMVPAAAVLQVAEACGRKGVRSLVVISAGFAEVGAVGREMQEELVALCRRHGMRLVGPNCMGVLNTHPDVRLNATFAPVPPPRGRVGFMSQSGALGLAVMDHAGALGLGLSSFVSVGNKADISGNDLIRYWAQDPDTDVILLYLESFGNPRNFAGIARRVARDKPIVAVKSGRFTAGARATGSHTGALIAASDVTVDALFRQAGVIRTDTLQQMFDVASLLANQPPPRGRRVAILTNAGGPGILCADTCEAEGLEVPVLSEPTQEALRGILASEASISNPVDMIASASAEQYRRAIEILAADPEVDSLVVIFVPPLLTRAADVARAVVEGAASAKRRKPIVTVFMQARGVPEELRGGEVRVPSYAFPEEAAMALARAAGYGEWLLRPDESPPVFDDIRRDEAAAILAGALGRGEEWLGPRDVADLLACYGLPALDQRVVRDPAEAAAAAAEIGGTVALKGIAPGLVHRTDAGAVQLDLRPEEVEAAATRMAAALRASGADPDGFLVQRMAPEGLEMILGVVHDDQFGPVIACGAGGVLVELVRDVAVRLAPLSRTDAAEMLTEIRTYPLLTGFRGSAPLDREALVDAILRVATLVDDLPQIRELDVNPIRVHERGVTLVDIRIRVAPTPDPSLLGSRR
jgi:acetate---CoA ligase (ADP-forming)